MIGSIIVTHNSAATIGPCLASLRDAGCKEIIVVDNASTDDTLQQLAAHQGQVIRNQTNYGFGAACNQGARLTGAPYLFFINPDAQLTPTSLDATVAYLENHDSVGAAGLKLLDHHGQPQPDNFGSEVTLGSMIWRKMWIRSRVGVRRHVAPEQHGDIVITAVPCDWVSGAALLVRRAAFMSVGGFDPSFFMYWEDIDLCRALRAAGWSIVFMPTATVIHQRGHSSTDQKNKTSWYDQSADRYFRKHYATTIWLLQHFWRQLYRWLVPQVQ